MDEELLREQGFSPVVLGKALLRDFALRIGDRATLVPAHDSTAYGMLIDLPDQELEALYSAPGVSEYVATPVCVELMNAGSTHQALSYNLPASQLSGEMNRDYAEKLKNQLLALDFPRAYAQTILPENE